MKKLMKFFGIVAVAAMSLTACQNEFDEQVNVNGGETVVVDITANAPATRSAFGDKVGTEYPSTWSGTELVGFIANPVDGTHETITDVENTTTDGVTATFTGVELSNVSTSGVIYAVSPRNTGNYELGGFSGIEDKYSNFYISIPKEQEPLAKSVDESAHLLFAKYEYNSTPANVVMNFQHIGAYGKMTIDHFDGEIAGITLIATQNIVGRGYCTYDGTVSFNDNYASETLTLNTSNTEVWFACHPVGTLTGNLTIVITDSEGATYTKELETANRLAFKAGQVSAFSVDMAGIEADVVETPESYDWVVVDPANALEAGDYVLVGFYNGNAYSLIATTTEGSNMGSVTTTDGNTKLNAETITDAMIFTLAGNSTDGYTLMNGTNYLYNKSTNNGVNIQSSSCTWNISTASDNEAAFTFKDKTQSRYLGIYVTNSTATNWRCYTSYPHTNYGNKGVYLYKKTTAVVDTNIAQELTYTPAEQTVVIGYESEFVAPVLEGAQTDVTYSSSNAEVATVDANSGVVTLVGGEGTATITATAERDETYKAAVATATITVEAVTLNDPADLEWTADDLTAQTITLSGKHLDKEGLTVEVSEPTNFTVTTDGFTLSIVPNAENKTEEAIENTITISIMNGETKLASRQVKLTQKGIVVASSKSYVKVTTGTIESGATYLIVANDGSTNYIFDGASVAKETPAIEATISNGTIESNTDTDSYAVTITSSGSGYKVLLSTGKYLVINSSTSSNGSLTSNTTGEVITITAAASADTFTFVSSNRNSRGLCWRSGYNFRNYATSNFSTSGYQGNLNLYKLAE